MGTSNPFIFILVSLLKMYQRRFVYKSSIRSFVWLGG